MTNETKVKRVKKVNVNGCQLYYLNGLYHAYIENRFNGSIWLGTKHASYHTLEEAVVYFFSEV